MNRRALNPGYPPHRPPSVKTDLRQTAPWITLPPHPTHAIVTALSQERERDFTHSVTD
jgi:hypothetical protein